MGAVQRGESAEFARSEVFALKWCITPNKKGPEKIPGQ